MNLNQTHDEARCSFVASANELHTEFPLQNLPLGAFSYDGSEATRVVSELGTRCWTCVAPLTQIS